MSFDDNDDEIARINRRKYEELLQRRLKKENPPVVPASTKPVQLTDASFSSTVSRNPLMVVDFWAPWCGPCRMVAPVMEELARDYAGRVAFGKLNVDENPMTASQFQVQSIPTILIFKNGQAIDGVLGAVPRSHLESKIRQYLSGDREGAPYS